jgi:hypothetical protein
MDAYVVVTHPNPAAFTRLKFYKVLADGTRGSQVAVTPNNVLPTEAAPFKISGLPYGTTQLEVTAYLDGNASAAPQESAGFKFPVTLTLDGPTDAYQVPAPAA